MGLTDYNAYATIVRMNKKQRHDGYPAGPADEYPNKFEKNPWLDNAVGSRTNSTKSLIQPPARLAPHEHAAEEELAKRIENMEKEQY